MSKQKRKKRPRKSLRTLLISWLIGISVAPLGFITAYSISNYEGAINAELNERILGNYREVQIVLQEYQSELTERNRLHAQDKQVRYFLASNRISQAREVATGWMRNHFAHQLSIFNQDGRMEVALFRAEDGSIKRRKNLEGADVYLSERFLKANESRDQSVLAEFTDKNKSLDLIAFSTIKSQKGVVIGYIEEIVKIDKTFLSGLKNRLGLEIMLFDAVKEQRVSSHDDLVNYRKGFFADQASRFGDNIFDLNIREIPYGFVVKSLSWGDDDFSVALGASKKASNAVLDRVRWAFISVVGTIVTLLILISIVISKIILRPLNELVDTIENIDFDSGPVELRSRSDNELGVLTESFNEMAGRVYDSQKKLKENIKIVEDANTEIRDTQAKLVHAAKMASLGQLVAGIAHELNNPISFIYSNMTHLKDYSDKLISIVKKADKKADLEKEKSEAEFDYITQDLPKLIHSCQEGARRTRDIVVGLRNFSRLEEAKVKEVDIHSGIDDTLALLEGEFQSRIQIVKKYDKEMPKVLCYPSQLNQVFMNILSNAAHAISGEGKITIATKVISSNKVEVKIQDTGKGMDDETREKIFDPFFTTKGVSRGTGLGMSISYGIIQKHGGDIVVKSKLNRGTEFIIQLPIRNT